MTIDAKKIAAALEWYSKPDAGSHLETLYAAASAYAATLPREVEIEQWAVIDSTNGKVRVTHNEKRYADRHADGVADRQVVRLTGTAVLPRVKD